MKNATNYKVTLAPQGWDSHQNCFVSQEVNVLLSTTDLETAKKAFTEAWEEREQHAAYHQAPIEIGLDMFDADGDLIDSYSGEGCPSGDATWHSYYDGEDCDGWYVLWATTGQKKYASSNCFGMIGHHQKEHFSTGYHALTFCDDRTGAMYADGLFKTAVEMKAYVVGIREIEKSQSRLENLAEVCGVDAGITAEVTVDHGVLYATARLEDGFNWEIEGAPSEMEYTKHYVLEGSGKLIEITIPEVEEMEVNDTATTGL